jgi:hypothetical protein
MWRRKNSSPSSLPQICSFLLSHPYLIRSSNVFISSSISALFSTIRCPAETIGCHNSAEVKSPRQAYCRIFSDGASAPMADLEPIAAFLSSHGRGEILFEDADYRPHRRSSRLRYQNYSDFE